MGKMRTIIVVGAIIEKDGRILLARRAAAESMAGKWEFPGGKLEAKETEKDALKREIKEEMKADIEVGGFYAESSWTAGHHVINLKCYKAKFLSAGIELINHDSIAWVDPKELPKYDMTPADKKIAKKLADWK